MELVIPRNLLDDCLIVLKDAEVSEVTEEDLFVEQTPDQSLEFTMLTKDNLDISRIDDITERDIDRLNRYKAALKMLGA